eukprot:Amastigsp_a341705_33.p2 type:complete len:204 gc:universal Amastigsp_a341705_33:704-1315(+)
MHGSGARVHQHDDPAVAALVLEDADERCEVVVRVCACAHRAGGHVAERLDHGLEQPRGGMHNDDAGVGERLETRHELVSVAEEQRRVARALKERLDLVDVSAVRLGQNLECPAHRTDSIKGVLKRPLERPERVAANRRSARHCEGERVDGLRVERDAVVFDAHGEQDALGGAAVERRRGGVEGHGDEDDDWNVRVARHGDGLR